MKLRFNLLTFSAIFSLTILTISFAKEKQKTKEPPKEPNTVKCIRHKDSSIVSFDCNPIYNELANTPTVKFIGVVRDQPMYIDNKNKDNYVCFDFNEKYLNDRKNYDGVNSCSMGREKDPYCIKDQISLSLLFAKSYRELVECENTAKKSLEMIREQNEINKCKALISKKPIYSVCNNDGTPGNWTCQINGSKEKIKLDGVSIPKPYLDTCEYMTAIDYELTNEINFGCDGNEKTCKNRSDYINKIKEKINSEYNSCLCEHPVDVKSSVAIGVCRANKWEKVDPTPANFSVVFTKESCVLLSSQNLPEESSFSDKATLEPYVSKEKYDEFKIDESNKKCVQKMESIIKSYKEDEGEKLAKDTKNECDEFIDMYYMWLGAKRPTETPKENIDLNKNKINNSTPSSQETIKKEPSIISKSQISTAMKSVNFDNCSTVGSGKTIITVVVDNAGAVSKVVSDGTPLGICVQNLIKNKKIIFPNTSEQFFDYEVNIAAKILPKEETYTKGEVMWTAQDNGKGAKPKVGDNYSEKYGLNWSQAKKYCDELTWSGYDDWRLPTAKEAKSLYNNKLPGYEPMKGFDERIFIPSEIQLSGYWIWTSEVKGSEAGFVGLVFGASEWRMQSFNDDLGRALCARSTK